MPITNKVLVVGQTPPPIHGQAVANQMLLDHAWKNWDVSFIRLEYSQDVDEVGNFGISKITHLFEVTYKTRKWLKENPNSVLFYPPASASWLPFLRDVFFLYFTRSLARGSVFIFHASGLPAFCKFSRFRRFLSKLCYHDPEVSLEVCREKIPAGETFNAKHSAYCPCAAELPENEKESKAEKATDKSLLFLGSLQEGKGIMEILKVAQVLKTSGHKNVHFRIGGKWASEDFRKECEEFCQTHDLADQVKFLGVVTGEQKWQEFKSSHGFFFPTHYSSEASPIVLMEALGMGLPIISTHWAGIPDLVRDCKAVRLCPSKDTSAFVEAIHQLPKPETVAEEAQSFYAQNFTPEKYIERIENAMNSGGLLLS